jgi:hypothetical protein
MEAGMEDYIVRIYRRKEESGGLFGVVEQVGVEGRKAFRSMEELLHLLRGGRQKADPMDRRLHMEARRAPSKE